MYTYVYIYTYLYTYILYTYIYMYTYIYIYIYYIAHKTLLLGLFHKKHIFYICLSVPMQLSNDTHMIQPWRHMSHVTHLKKPRHKYGRVMAHI